MEKERFGSFTRRVLIVLGLVALALLLWQIVHVLLLAFAGVLLAVILHGTAKRLSAYLPISTRWPLPLAGLLILGTLTLIGWLIGPEVARQLQQLTQRIPQTLDQLAQYRWGQFILQRTPSPQELIDVILTQVDVLSRVTGVVSTVLSVLANALLVLFIGIYFALYPDWYKNGLVQLAPKARRAHLRAVLDTTGRALWKWLLGTLISMALIGALTTGGLLLLGMPLALALGVIAALLEFFPYIGPFLSAVPAVLLALVRGPTQALYVILLYIAVQQIESNIIYPLVQQREVALPPALTVLALVAAGLLFGLYGILLATPLLVVVLVFVKMLYIEGVLGEPAKVPGEE